MEPNEIQLRILFEVLRQELPFQWRARYVEMLPSNTLALNFQHATNDKWRRLYIIREDGQWTKSEYYV